MHDLRTTGATWLHEAGVDRHLVGVLLGHRTQVDRGAGVFTAGGSVTGLYTKIFERTLRDVVAVFDAIRARYHFE